MLNFPNKNSCVIYRAHRMNNPVPNRTLCCSAETCIAHRPTLPTLLARHCSIYGDLYNSDSVHTSRGQITGHKLRRWIYRVHTGAAIVHYPVLSHIQDSIDWVTRGFLTHFCMSRRIWTSRALPLWVWHQKPLG